ncbi:glycosyltransferase family 4 protein [Saccharolobus sp.]|uniref:glycosyltransferase family 4 protein n=1 Tax=Saccharolobus sp. TaxID=2100761 RepID=UPI00316E98F9
MGLVCRFPLSKKFYSFQLAEGLRNLGVQVLLYGPKWGGLQTLKEEGKILKVWSPLTYIIDIPRRAIRDRVNVIHIQFEVPTFHLIGSLLLPLLLLILKIVKKKIVITIHGPIFPRENALKYLKVAFPSLPFSGLARILTLGLYLLMDRLSDGVIVHAKIFKKWLTEFGLKKVYVIYHGIENEGVKSNNKRDIILCLGTIAPRKGVHTFLHAISLIKDELKNKAVKAIVAGPLPSILSNKKYLYTLVKLYANVKDIVTMKSFISDNELEAYLKRTKVVCLPYPVSISASGVLALAISKGIPVIVSDTPYFREILSDEYPFFINPDDSQTLSNLIYDIINDDLILQRVHQKLLFLMKKFSWNNIAQQHVELYRKLLSTSTTNFMRKPRYFMARIRQKYS